MNNTKELSNLLWCEKYRPHDYQDVVGLDPQLPRLINDAMPHLLFLGGAGTGKTTTAKIIINKLGCDYLMLNASDERGIETIRGKVKAFAMTSSANKKFKIILFDESDYLTDAAQAMLRGLIEAYAKNCKFILTANFENRIIEPLQSRCTKFHFRRLKNEDIVVLLKYICEKENVVAVDDDLIEITEFCKGDIRKCVNVLQKSVKDGMIVFEKGLLVDEISEIIKKTDEGNWEEVIKTLEERGVDYEYLLKETFKYVIEKKEYKSQLKKPIVLLIAEMMYRMKFVSDKVIIFSQFLIELEKIYVGDKNAK